MKTPQQFLDWLEGYLDARKDGLSAGDAETIRARMRQVRPQIGADPDPIFIPYFAPAMPPDPNWETTCSNNEPAPALQA